MASFFEIKPSNCERVCERERMEKWEKRPFCRLKLPKFFTFAELKVLASESQHTFLPLLNPFLWEKLSFFTWFNFFLSLFENMSKISSMTKVARLLDTTDKAQLKKNCTLCFMLLSRMGIWGDFERAGIERDLKSGEREFFFYVWGFWEIFAFVVVAAGDLLKNASAEGFATWLKYLKFNKNVRNFLIKFN